MQTGSIADTGTGHLRLPLAPLYITLLHLMQTAMLEMLMYYVLPAPRAMIR